VSDDALVAARPGCHDDSAITVRDTMNQLQNDARTNARQQIKSSIPAERWEANNAFTGKLCETIAAHHFVRHPLIDAMNAGHGDIDWLKNFYLDTVHAVSKEFLGYVLQAGVNCAQIDRMVGIRGVNAARFLLQINVIDELGFTPGGEGEDFLGNPKNAHSSQLFDVMEQLGITEARFLAHTPSPWSRQAIDLLQDNRHDHLRLATILAALESSLNPWTACWAKATALVSAVDTATGYHAIHTEDDHGHLVDDDHSEDSWYIVRQALTADRYAEIEALTEQLMTVLAAFADRHLSLIEEFSAADVA
jgi:hypothetical protein